MSAWSRQWRVSDKEDGTEAAVYYQQKTGWKQNEFQSNSREVQSKEWREDQELRQCYTAGTDTLNLWAFSEQLQAR